MSVLNEEHRRRWKSLRQDRPAGCFLCQLPCLFLHTRLAPKPSATCMHKKKKATSTGERVFANTGVHKEAISKICKLLFQLNLKRANNRIGKGAKDLHGNFSQEGLRIDIKPVKTGSASLLQEKRSSELHRGISSSH